MATMPLKKCMHAGCRKLVRSSRCPDHTKQQNREGDANRPTSNERGYDAHWRKARLRFLTEHPLCVECQAVGRITAAGCVDHITPHRGDEKLFWDSENWQALCNRCHSRKTARGE